MTLDEHVAGYRHNFGLAEERQMLCSIFSCSFSNLMDLGSALGNLVFSLFLNPFASDDDTRIVVVQQPQLVHVADDDLWCGQDDATLVPNILSATQRVNDLRLQFSDILFKLMYLIQFITYLRLEIIHFFLPGCQLFFDGFHTLLTLKFDVS